MQHTILPGFLEYAVTSVWLKWKEGRLIRISSPFPTLLSFLPRPLVAPLILGKMTCTVQFLKNLLRCMTRGDQEHLKPIWNNVYEKRPSADFLLPSISVHVSHACWGASRVSKVSVEERFPSTCTVFIEIRIILGVSCENVFFFCDVWWFSGSYVWGLCAQNETDFLS